MRNQATTQSVLIAVAMAALTALGAALGGCDRGTDRSAPVSGEAASSAQGRVLIVGVDGLEWNVVLPLVAEGRMPNLETLMQRGVFGTLSTYAPAKSPVIWTTVATGKIPEKHGILDFRKPGPSEPRPFYTSRDRRTKALWNILSDAGRTVTVIGWWNTYPAAPINGVMVAQTNTESEFRRRRLIKGGIVRGVPGQVHPADRQDEMLGIFAGVERELPVLLEQAFGNMGEIAFIPNRRNWEGCQWAFRSDEAYRRIALELLDEPPLPDCFAVYFGLPDVVGHRFWRFHEPGRFRHPPHPGPQRTFGNVINDAYAMFDETLGDVLSRCPDETNVFVLSDHGMHAANRDRRFDGSSAWEGIPFESGAHLDGPAGVFVAAGPAIRRGRTGRPIRELRKERLAEMGSVVDIAPTVLALLGLPLGRDMDGSVMSDIFAPELAIDRSVDYVATHDTPEWLASRGMPPPEIPGLEERTEQLRALGYLGSSKDSSSEHEGGEP